MYVRETSSGRREPSHATTRLGRGTPKTNADCSDDSDYAEEQPHSSLCALSHLSCLRLLFGIAVVLNCERLGERRDARMLSELVGQIRIIRDTLIEPARRADAVQQPALAALREAHAELHVRLAVLSRRLRPGKPKRELGHRFRVVPPRPAELRA